jgi:hypothetical protein
MWRSLVAHLVRDEGVVGSNPIIPICLGYILDMDFSVFGIALLDRFILVSNLKKVFQNTWKSRLGTVFNRTVLGWQVED